MPLGEQPSPAPYPALPPPRPLFLPAGPSYYMPGAGTGDDMMLLGSLAEDSQSWLLS